jgi:hypothetical protein
MELTKEKLEKFIEDFEKDPITVKWVESVENRGKYQRDLDTSFYELSRSTINKLIDLIVFMNTIYGSVDKVTEQIVVEQDKYLELVDEFETILKKLQNGNKG